MKNEKDNNRKIKKWINAELDSGLKLQDILEKWEKLNQSIIDAIEAEGATEIPKHSKKKNQMPREEEMNPDEFLYELIKDFNDLEKREIENDDNKPNQETMDLFDDHNDLEKIKEEEELNPNEPIPDIPLDDDFISMLTNMENDDDTPHQKIEDDAQPVPSVKQMIKKMNDTIIGQEKTKEDLATVIRKHMQKIRGPENRHFKKNVSQDIIDAETQKNNLIIMGNTGTGKTLLAETLAKNYNIPMVVVDATSYSPSGYKGEDLRQMIKDLYYKANRDIERAEKGIIFLDEIDKLRFDIRGCSTDKTAKHCIQYALLKIIEGTEVNINGSTIDTSNILFIGCGSFGGIEEINELDKIKPKDLIEYGFIPEFIGRMPIITYTEPLTEKMLERILTEPKNSEIKQCQKTFICDGIRIKFTKSAIKEMARQAWELNIGARGLKTLIDKVTRDYYIRLPHIPKKITINKKYVIKQLDGEQKENDIQPVPSVKQMIKETDDSIIGQEKAKEYLASVLRKHVQENWGTENRPFKKNISQDIINAETQKNNLIIMGNTGTGKTLLAETFARTYNIPMVVVDATNYTQTGYKGADPTEIIQALYHKAKKHIKRAEKGIIFMDEIDKLRFDKTRHSEDISSKHGIQQSLLKIIEGTKVNINGRTIDTSKILFIGCGSFVDIKKIIEKRIAPQKKAIGFDNNKMNLPTRIQDEYKKNILNEIIPEDLVEYGFLPEFVGRMPNITHTEPLTKEMLERILTEPKNSEVKQCQKNFAYDGIEIQFTECAIDEIARQAWKQNIGARGLKRIINEITKDYYNRSPHIPEFITINKKYVIKQLNKKKRLPEIRNTNSKGR